MSETKHHPTPYKVRKMPYMSSEGYYRLDILDAGDCVVAGIGVAKEDWPNAKTAEFLVEAANAHERLVAENARLRDLVRRMKMSVKYHRAATGDYEILGRLLRDANAAIEDGEEACDGND